MTPDAGHDLNLQLNAPFTYESIITFADQAVGTDGDMKETYLENCGRLSGSHTEGMPQFGA